MDNKDELYFLSRNHTECDIVLGSIIDSKRERLEKIEITTFRDVYEKIVWENEIKTPPTTKKKKLVSPLPMDNGNTTITENQGAPLLAIDNVDQTYGIAAINAVDGVISESNELNADLLNTSEASIYYEIENDNGTESAQTATNQDSSFYPPLEDVKQIEADINKQSTTTKNTVANIDESENEYSGDSKETEKHNSKDAYLNEAMVHSDEEDNTNNQSSNENYNSNNKISNYKSNKIDDDDNLSSNNISTDRSRSMNRSIDNSTTNSRGISTASSVIVKDYPHDRNDQFSKLTRKYFKYIHRYHIGDTLSNYFRGQFQMQMRAIGANYLTVGLFGQAGSGKSAFLNSLYSSMNGTYVEYSPERRTEADSEMEPGATSRRVELRLTETIVVLDNRATDFSKSSINEIVKQCGELVDFSYFLYF